jgi:predicted enzyme related to lactoylglutathione lyase
MKKFSNALRWFEIPVSDLERAQAFYENIFQAELTPVEVGETLKMALFPVESGTIGGALCQHKDFYHPGHQGPVLYLNGDPDLQPILDRVEAAGGKVIIKKQQISEEYGFMGIFEDSEGNRIGVQSSQ